MQGTGALVLTAPPWCLALWVLRGWSAKRSLPSPIGPGPVTCLILAGAGPGPPKGGFCVGGGDDHDLPGIGGRMTSNGKSATCSNSGYSTGT